MTPLLHIRSFTDDQYWLDKVFYTNSYRIKGFKDREKAPVVVDIGAHCGYFTFTSLALGAKKVYAVEPFVENFKVLIKNAGENTSIVPYLLGISNSMVSIAIDYPTPEKSHINFSNLQVNSFKSEKQYICPSTTLDDFLGRYVSETTIDILKINIGYQERDILASSTLLSEKVKAVCGETVLEPEYVATFKAEMSAKGFVNSHVIASSEEDNKILFIFAKGKIEDYFSL